ncbi:MAG: hypothetical protein KDE59_27405, partial [Anaerolineales bacterium]|nr:hypothetical protein [Anaerolineales bacterium]
PKNTPTTQPAAAQPEATTAAATPDYILYLQRTIGNRAVEGKLQQLPRPPQMMARQRPAQATPSTGVWRWQTATVRPQRKLQVQRHTSVALAYEENSVQAKRDTAQLQRHTSIPLAYEENSVQAKRDESVLPAGQLIQRDLIDDLNEAMDGWGADKQAMKNAIIAASATEKEQGLNDPRLVARLQDQLSRADALEILTDLGATLSKRLEVAMNGWGADANAIITMVEGLPASKAAEKDAVLRNPTLMNRLKDELSQEQAVRVLTGLGAPIAERIYAAMAGWGVDTATIITICTNATAAEKQAAARDRALIARLTEEISQGYLVQSILKELNVSIIDRLHVAMDGWGVDAQSILNMAYEASADEKQLILHDRETLSRLQSELSREDMLTVLKNIDASLTDRLNVALSGWGVDSAAILEMIPQVSEEQRLAAYSDAQLMADLEAQMSAEDFRQARLLLRFGSQEAIDAASEEELNAATSPENLTSLITAELAKDEPDTAKIMTDIAAATPADKELVRANSSLMERLAGALSPEDYRQAQNLLGDSLINQLHTLIDQEAG